MDNFTQILSQLLGRLPFIFRGHKLGMTVWLAIEQILHGFFFGHKIIYKNFLLIPNYDNALLTFSFFNNKRRATKCEMKVLILEIIFLSVSNSFS